MLIIFRGLGLVWGVLGMLLLLPVFFITGSAGAAFSLVAACWIYFGRGHFEPSWCQVLDSDGKRKAPAVFFIPVWVYGILVIPLALGGFILDITFRLRNDVKDLDGQYADANSTNSNDKGCFERANYAITSSKRGSGHGNTERARELASAYSGLMKEISEAAFTGGGKGVISMTDGEFLVHCQMNEDKSVAFLVHVPQLRQYKDDVRDTLADLCWKAARTLLKDTGATDDIELAVALRGTMLYGPIMIDRLANETTANDRSKESLYRFFPDPSNEIPEAVQGAGINLDSSMSLSSNDGDIRRFRIAEEESKSGGIEHGNTEKARDLALEYQIRLCEFLRESLRSDKSNSFSRMNGNEFHVYCQMNQGESVALLVRVPSLSEYNADMRDALAASCWKTARTLFKKKGAPDDFELAVALLGVVPYGPIMIDRLANETTPHDQPEKEIYRFFPEPSNEIPAAVQGSGIRTEESPVDPPTDSTGGEPGAIRKLAEVKAAAGSNSSINDDTSTSLSQSQTTRRPETAGPDGPGEPVTAETELRPGQKLAGYWGSEWSQVVVTGFNGDDVLTGWVHSNTWTSFRMSRSKLRVVSDEEYAQCKVSYSDEPIIHQPLADDMEIKAGQQLLCKIEKFWLPVEVTGPESDVGVPIHWTGFSSHFDDHVERGQLALQHSNPKGQASRPSTRPSATSGFGTRPETRGRDRFGSSSSSRRRDGSSLQTESGRKIAP